MFDRDPKYSRPFGDEPDDENSLRRAEYYAAYKEGEGVIATIGFGIITVCVYKYNPEVTPTVLFSALTLGTGTYTGFMDRARRTIRRQRKGYS